METEAKPEKQDVVMRPCTADDVDTILALQNKTFNTSRTIADWRWNNDENPDVANATAVAFVDSKMIGTYSIIGCSINYFGKKILGGQSTNTILSKEYQGRGFFVPFVEYSLKMAANQFAMRLAFGFPNQKALPINLLRLNLKTILSLPYYEQRLKSGSKNPLLALVYSLAVRCILAHRSRSYRKSFGQPLSLTIGETLPSGYQTFFVETFLPSEKICLWKDAQYMEWRYDKSSLPELRYFTCFVGDKICAVAVAARHMGNILIHEVLVADKNVPLARFLLNSICTYYFEQGIDLVRFYGYDSGFFEHALSDFQRDPGKDEVFVGKVLCDDDEFEQNLVNELNWSVTAGDFYY